MSRYKLNYKRQYMLLKIVLNIQYLNFNKIQPAVLNGSAIYSCGLM